MFSYSRLNLAPGGALIQQGSCDTETGAITLNVTNAQGYSVYVSGCSSTDGESVASANEQVTITGCNAQLVGI